MIKKNNLFLNCQENQTSKFGVLRITRACLVIHMVKILPAIRETWVRSLGWEDPLEEGMATCSSILAWRTPMGRGA